MLSELMIKDFTLLRELEIEFGAGLTILTGETGAGKSILLDAITLALGGRADTHWIRHGSERCEITASFTIDDLPFVQTWLQEHNLSSDSECILRRSLSQDGRSRGTINGIAVPMQLLKELGHLLLHIHGQHEQYALFKREHLTYLLDRYANHEALLKEVRQQFLDWQKIHEELAQLQTTNDLQKLEFLQFQVQELQRFALSSTELIELETLHKRLAHAESLQVQCQRALHLLNDAEDINILKLLHQTDTAITTALQMDPRLINVQELLNNAEIQLQEAYSELSDYLPSIDLDPSALQKAEQRLSDIHEIARKYRVNPEKIPELTTRLEQDLDKQQHCDKYQAMLQEKLAAAAKAYGQIAELLTASRNTAAQKLSQQVTQGIRKLGMPMGEFKIELSKQTHFTQHGLDQIEFLVTANPGQPLQALHKVASGGELARINLAIQVITAKRGNTPSLIFDEVDAGIGGGVAEIVGQLLRDLGKHAQVLCVTHLPQVAAKGHHHLQVSKTQSKTETKVKVSTLTAPEKVKELARMLGGLKITAQTLAHAKEMLGTD